MTLVPDAHFNKFLQIVMHLSKFNTCFVQWQMQNVLVVQIYN